MTTKQLGIFALIGAPCLAIGLSLGYINSPWMSVWGILYISGWTASIVALNRLGVLETDPEKPRNFGHIVGRVIVVTLILANISNVWEVVAPTDKSIFFYIIDIGWPGSNLLMLAVGVAALRAKRLRGWQRWVPLAVGFWLPVTMLIKDVPALCYGPITYSAIAWTLLAVVVLRESSRQQAMQPSRT